MTWSDDSFSESTWNITRPAYLPPHLRATTNSNRSRGRGGISRGGRRRRPRSHPRSSPANPFELADKFDELEMTDGNGDGNREASVINVDAYEDIPVKSTGSNVPPPVSTFAEIDLGEALAENIKRCKYVKPTPIQRHAIPIALAGRDLMACAQTGSGKTAAFCFPIIRGLSIQGWTRVRGSCSGRVGGPRAMAFPSALILSPTRELSAQIHKEASKFAYNTGLKTVVAYGGTPIVHQFRNLEKGVDILVATPGRLSDMIERGRVSLAKIKYFAIDEADRMLDMGFEPQIRKIVQEVGMPPPGERQTMLFSATFPPEIQRLASDFLSNYIFLTVGRVGSSTDLIVQKVLLVQHMDKRSHLVDILRSQKAIGSCGKDALTVVFVETKRGADVLECWLSNNGFPAVAIHGDKVQMERERALRSFKSGATPILVATDVASRGLDIPHISHVINFDLPKDIDDYVHRIGRTGRAGKAGLATAFFGDKNLSLAKPLAELMKEANQEVPYWLGQYADSYLYGGSSSRRSKQYSGRTFGGCDYRGDVQSRNENHYSIAYAGSDAFGNSSSSFSKGFGYKASESDFAASSGNDGYAVPVATEYTVSDVGDYYAASTTDSFVPGTADSIAAAPHGFGAGCETIVATGWD